jgi:hypothetical protein
MSAGLLYRLMHGFTVGLHTDTCVSEFVPLRCSYSDCSQDMDHGWNLPIMLQAGLLLTPWGKSVDTGGRGRF